MLLQVGVKLLIQRHDQYLFLRRSKAFKLGPQKWDIPGGRIEPHESLEKALTRELQEETGLNLESIEKLLAAQDIFVPEKDLHVVRLTYLGTTSGEVKLSDEHDEYRWMTLKETARETEVDTYLNKMLSTEFLDEHPND